MKFDDVSFLLVCLCALRIEVLDGKAIGSENKGPAVMGGEEEVNEHETKLQKRSYYNLSPNNPNYFSLYEASQYWKPATYKIHRPYVIPVYVTNRFPIFYPPQPVYINPGQPIDNPLKPPFMGSTYLPPVPSDPTPTQTAPNGTIGNRLGEDDDKPVWGNSPSVQLSGNNNKESDPIPTRAPPNRPPAAAGSILEHGQAQPPATSNVRTTTVRSNFIGPATTSAPSGPSNCVWAIVSCCSVTATKELSQNCFEQRGCPGPFWGASPCDGEFARAAIQAAVQYYGANN